MKFTKVLIVVPKLNIEMKLIEIYKLHTPNFENKRSLTNLIIEKEKEMFDFELDFYLP